MAKTTKRYTPAPQVAPGMAQRLGVMLAVLAGRLTVAQGARELGMSRNHFQTLLHRGLASFTEAIEPKPGGRPAKPKALSQLEEEVQRLRRENARLSEQAATTERLLKVASGFLQARGRSTRSRARKTGASRDEDGEGEPRRKLVLVRCMRRQGLSAEQAARVAGVHPATVRRWCARLPDHRPLQRHSREDAPRARAVHRVEHAVRRLHGLVGARALCSTVSGISRRQAARVKAKTLTAMERERKAAHEQVTVTAPGIVRGLDGLHLATADGVRHALVVADAAVPFRTEVKLSAHYDTKLVERAIAQDIEKHGAPLVYRLDRAKAHDAQDVKRLLERHGVLAMHGPPHCPRYYGQLERQNREHRQWLGDVSQLSASAVRGRLNTMIAALNEAWPRRKLGWKTARVAWEERHALTIDRKQFAREVEERAARIGRTLQSSGKPADLARRLAIEQALQSRGLLRRESGGWC